MLGLREQIHRHPVGRRRAIGEHENFARAGDHVDADLAEDLLLGAGDISVAGPGDLVNARDRRGAVGQRSDSLRAADGEHAVHAGDVRSGEDQRVLLTSWRGHDHDDFAHASHTRRHDVHQHGRRVRRLAARHINADAVERRDFLAEQRALGVAVGEAAAAHVELALVVRTNALGRGFERAALFGRDRVECGGEFVSREFERGHAWRIQAVEASGVLEHGCIATLSHVGNDAGDCAVDRRVGPSRPLKRSEQRFEIGLRRRKPSNDHDCTAFSTACSRASISGRIASRFNFNAA